MAVAPDDRPLPEAANLVATATTVRHHRRFRTVRRWYRRTPTSQLVLTLTALVIVVVAIVVVVLTFVVG